MKGYREREGGERVGDGRKLFKRDHWDTRCDAQRSQRIFPPCLFLLLSRFPPLFSSLSPYKVRRENESAARSRCTVQ